MRWFTVVLEGDGVPRPFVLGESSDETWLRDCSTWKRTVTLSEDEIRLDPDLAGILEAWRGEDDSAQAEFMAIEDAEIAATDALMEIEWENEGRPEPPEWSPKDPWTLYREAYPELTAALEDALQSDDQGSEPSLSTSAGRYYWATFEAWLRLEAIRVVVDETESLKHARRFARELVQQNRRKGIEVF